MTHPSESEDRNLGEQPLASVMLEHGVKPHDLVEASTEQITHKMVTRCCKGRRCTTRTKMKVRNALNRVTEQCYSLDQLFSY